MEDKNKGNTVTIPYDSIEEAARAISQVFGKRELIELVRELESRAEAMEEEPEKPG